MVKKAIITVNLVEESEEYENSEIEMEILKELQRGIMITIPWMKSVKEVTVVEDQ